MTDMHQENMKKIAVGVLLVIMVMGAVMAGYMSATLQQNAVAPEQEIDSNATSSENIDEVINAIEWKEYNNDELGMTLRYPALSVDNQLWGNLTETMLLSEILLPNQVVSKGSNIYLRQQYKLTQDEQSGEVVKRENVFIPEYDGTYSYPEHWHIIVFDVNDEAELDKVIKMKLGPGCAYSKKIPTEFEGNYRVEIVGDGKDLGSTLCPVNYMNYILYSPEQKKVAFWSTGQECQIGVRFGSCFDQKISESVHFSTSN